MSNGRVTVTRRHESGETSQKSGKQMCGTALRSCDVIFGCVDSIGERQQIGDSGQVLPHSVYRCGDGRAPTGRALLHQRPGRAFRCPGDLAFAEWELLLIASLN